MCRRFLREFVFEDRRFVCFKILIFATGTDWFFLLGKNFCDFQKVLDKSLIIFPFLSSTCNRNTFFFSKLASGRAESCKYGNLIGSESGLYFTILPSNPGGIVGSFIRKFVCCLSMSKNRHFQTIYLLKLALLLTLAREK